MIHLHNMDCMEAMAQMPDNAFDLAIVDPPYGIKQHKGIRFHNKQNVLHKSKDWDYRIPPKKYFEELKRVSQYYIIWGGNYFVDYLQNSRCWLVWNKKNGGNNMSDCELAYTNFNSSVRMFSRSHIEDHNQGIQSIHPTQKPIALYTFCLNKYAKKGWRILDTHLGSGSSAIAAYNAGYEFHGYEIDTDYYNAAKKRFENHKRQLRMFV